MRKMLMAAAATVALTWTASAQVGETPPELGAVKWYTPPLALAQMQGKAILVEVFRTW